MYKARKQPNYFRINERTELYFLMKKGCVQNSLRIAQRASLLVFGDGGAAGADKFAERTSQLVSHFVSVSRMNNFD